MLLSGFWQASKNRHWAVVASVVNYFMLHLGVRLKMKLLVLELEEAYGK